MKLIPVLMALAGLGCAALPYDGSQLPLGLLSSHAAAKHPVDPSIYAAIATYDDPVDALLHLKPELKAMMAEPRLLRVFGTDAEWMTEGDKLRLRRAGKQFIDLTENTPNITHQRWVRPVFDDLDLGHMYRVLEKATSFFNRYYHAETGVASARWLHDHIAGIISQSPAAEFISLEYHTHRFPQPSIIARFEPPTRNASLPLTIIGAHQDSANYLFPLLPAPGADDDMSGSTSILEAFRALANRGFIPQHGPVEFHWYAAEEAGLLGSQEIVAYKLGQGAKDMTAFVARNSTPSIVIIENDADDSLTHAGAGSDYMSWTQAGYPSAFATEGDPMRGGFPGDYDRNVHTAQDIMDIDDETGVFSLELAVAFAVEQAGWSDKHTREDDNKAW
ncbi:hypothetical protein IAU60_001916 [Kwoniella sp. DSM 27419]